MQTRSIDVPKSPTTNKQISDRDNIFKQKSLYHLTLQGETAVYGAVDLCGFSK